MTRLRATTSQWTGRPLLLRLLDMAMMPLTMSSYTVRFSSGSALPGILQILSGEALEEPQGFQGWWVGLMKDLTQTSHASFNHFNSTAPPSPMLDSTISMVADPSHLLAPSKRFTR
jgi:hypothetical protein